ncbi:ArgS-related anticodon-binding protein NrtL [Streptomyces sp. UNOB3_S3]|uniref:ArgS-related anticodon-binding protein NrtL n=1 Tax=Streptomyces sp. UNOB3_S3 TaxID=2871682 RepID=UPI001E38E3CF|nr:DALR anticodon-binding domain-containing protein [Streptomyces sp. UNOB3_S3]MCC3774005.1 arginine--tRNA ligase [Streptomyces sp. UNOB3_S3]
MTPADLSRTVLHTVRRAVEDDELCAPVPERVSVRVPPRPGCGDYATNVALQLAKGGDRPALEIAEVLRRRLVARPGIARVDIAGPGFLNITLDAASGEEIVREVLAAEYSADALSSTPSPELLARLGSDAARWSLLSPPGLDRSLLLVQKDGNPLFRVRYAHARSRALQRNARDLGFGSSVGPLDSSADALLGALADHARITAARAPERLARHLERTADAFLRWQAGCPVLPRGDEKPSAVHRARLALAEATGKVLANGLTQLGITAPAHL